MMNSEDYKMKEYELLKDEINRKVELRNSIVNYMLTATLAILAVSFTSGNSSNFWIFVLPQPLIIIMSLRYGYYSKSIAKISAYLHVFLEEDNGFQWESKNKIMEDTVSGGFFLRNAEFVVMSLLPTLILLIDLCIKKLSDAKVPLVISVICWIIVCLITNDFCNIKVIKKNFIDDWKEIKEKK